MKKSLLVLTSAVSLVLTIAACSDIPNTAYYNRGQPEHLLDVSKEEMELDIVASKKGEKKAVNAIMGKVMRTDPSSAELKCDNSSTLCDKLERALYDQGISATRVASSENKLVLTYTRVTARECANRYIDNSINPYNLNYPSFGCSMASNAVQMVTDKRQYTDPKVMDSAEGFKAAQTIDAYRTASKPSTDFNAIVTLDSIASSSGR